MGVPPGAEPSEDCLVLNIWRPANDASMLPVMIWIHGGGYVSGSSSTAITQGTSLARQGLVVVSLNYRLGRLGFFAHPALVAAHEGPVGNFGYMDQIAALKWVQANIASFGGDPDRVTLVGESAGGASVLQLMTSPATAGLFQRVVVMSGGGRRSLSARRMTGGTPDHPSADQSDAAFAKSRGIDGDGPEALARLRALSVQSLVDDLTVSSILIPAILAGASDFDGTPMIDGTIVVAQPGDVFRRNGQAKVPMIIGTTALDLPLFFPPRSTPYSYFGEDEGAAKAAYDPNGSGDVRAALPGLPLGIPGPSAAVIAIAADITMHEPARFAAKSVAAGGSPAWLYRFTYVAQDVPGRSGGASHSQEVPYLFDTLDAFYGPAELTEIDRMMAREFSTYIADFVKNGDPRGANLPDWPQFDQARFDLMNFTLEGRPMFGADPRTAGVRLVEKIADQQQKQRP
jgi:para-nitrobenzyl esterase